MLLRRGAENLVTPLFNQLTLYRFSVERDKELVSARLLRSDPQQERSVLLVDQFTERWLHRTSARRQQLACATSHATRACSRNSSRVRTLTLTEETNS